jgi:membrane-anchored protein YejM (alkaline phosphatase superfamily)
MADPVSAQVPETRNVILITIDGLRWQEAFSGADRQIMDNDSFVSADDRGALEERFWAATPTSRRRKLMPFVWDSVSTLGVIFGNRSAGSRVNITNSRAFSYPGYNEILTGFADDRIDSNDKNNNANVTVLEWLNMQEELKGKVAAYASWDVFPYIINESRAELPVNAGFEPVRGVVSRTESVLNKLQVEIETPWESERFDGFTHYLAMEYLARERPRLLYIGYGDTDEYAHSGDYGAYLTAANRVDSYIAQLWNWVQSDPEYRDKTTFVVAVDHGRGTGERWVGHGADWEGSDAVWIAVFGPDTPPLGEYRERSQLYQDQIAATVAAFLGYNYSNARPVGAPIGGVMEGE